MAQDQLGVVKAALDGGESKLHAIKSEAAEHSAEG
jgi:hypothetical protein